MIVKPKTTVAKILTLFLTSVYCAFITASILIGLSAQVVETMTQIFVVMISTLLGFSLWNLITDTSQLAPGDFKEIYYPNYVVSFLCLAVIFVVSYNKHDLSFDTILGWTGAGIGIVLTLIISSLQANAVVTTKKGEPEEGVK